MPHSNLISIVITTYNRSDALVKVIQALELQTDRNFEVIVADDGSSLEHQGVIFNALAGSCLSCSYLWHPDVGFTVSKVRNCGVAIAKGDYLIFLDGDCVPEIDFVRQHRRLSQEKFFVNGSRVLLSELYTRKIVLSNLLVAGQTSFFWMKNRLIGFSNKIAPLIRLGDYIFRQSSVFHWVGIRACNMGVWRIDFEAVDGFDESFQGWGHEDADFVLRLYNYGVMRKNGFFATEVYHLWHKQSNRSEESLNFQRVVERQASKQVKATVGYSTMKQSMDLIVRKF
jgi:glycosyltransferase involved in cell wall biosynthesis